jgi:hypothetical protein
MVFWHMGQVMAHLLRSRMEAVTKASQDLAEAIFGENGLTEAAKALMKEPSWPLEDVADDLEIPKEELEKMVQIGKKYCSDEIIALVMKRSMWRADVSAVLEERAESLSGLKRKRDE